MKLVVLLLVLAAALSWAAMELRANSLSPTPPVAAQRGRTAQPESPVQGTIQAAATEITTAAAPAPPLFRPRQAASASIGPEPGESFALAGLAGERENRIAFVRDLADQSITRARVGDRVGEWVVDEIDERCTSLRRGRRRERVCL